MKQQPRRGSQPLGPLLITALLVFASVGPAAESAEPLASRGVDYLRDVRPILSNHCYACHGPDDLARRGDLRLDQRDAAIGDLPTGSRAIVPGKPDDSELLARISTTDDATVMPPPGAGKRLSTTEVETLRRWIAEGAPYAVHWAYIPPVRPSLPAVSQSDWCRNPIDRFVLERLDREGVPPSPPASRAALLRRAAIDLTGLPPAPHELERYLQDERPEAFEAAVDRLLASPAYGERWGAMWLDLARYGDSAGYIHDPLRTIWRWRDWLVQALNANLPYDQFTIEMLAGDLLPNATTEQIIATGFHRNTTTNTEGGSNAAEYHFASVVDRVNTTLQVWMGTTIACAQCHNHKYDPFTQKDYYRLAAVFNSQEDFNSEWPSLEVPRPGAEADFVELSARLADARRVLETEGAAVDPLQEVWEDSFDRASLPREVGDAISVPVAKRTPQQAELVRTHHRSTHAAYRAQADAVKRARAAVDRVTTTAMILREIAPRPTHVLLRGDIHRPADLVTPGVPAALHAALPQEKFDRMALARWIIDPQNPLTARVAVNRLWQELFGVGLVETSEEFGTQGDLPSHPELLDWLATEYVRLDWNTKELLKLIVTSATYRQSSLGTADLIQSDPNNRLFARGPRVRLSAEQLRDQALAVAGLLSPKLYGPPVHPYQPTNGLAAAFGSSTDWQTSTGEDAYRRALYTLWRRNMPYPSMIAFDVPERSVCSVRRIRTNTPVQALVTLNDPVFVEAAQALARRILADGGATNTDRAAFGLRLTLSRSATASEITRVAQLAEAAKTELATVPDRAQELATRPRGPLPSGVDVLDAAAWTVVANVLLNLDEVLVKR